MATTKIRARYIQKGDTLVSKTGQTADVFEVSDTGEGIHVILDTEFGSVERQYPYDETVEVIR